MPPKMGPMRGPANVVHTLIPVTQRPGKTSATFSTTKASPEEASIGPSPGRLRQGVHRHGSRHARPVSHDSRDASLAEADVLGGHEVQDDRPRLYRLQTEGGCQFHRVHNVQSPWRGLRSAADLVEHGECFFLDDRHVHRHSAAPDSTARREALLKHRDLHAAGGEEVGGGQAGWPRSYDEDVTFEPSGNSAQIGFDDRLGDRRLAEFTHGLYPFPESSFVRRIRLGGGRLNPRRCCSPPRPLLSADGSFHLSEAFGL